MSIELIELFDIFSGTFGKEKAQIAIKDIESLIADHKRELAAKSNLQETEHRLNNSIDVVKIDLHNEIREVELKLTKEIELVRKDIANLHKDIANLHNEMREIELSLIKEISDSKSSTIRWVIGFIISQTVILLTVITLLKLT